VAVQIAPTDAPPPRSVARTVAIGVAVVVVAVISLYLIYLLRKPISWIVIAGFIAVAVSGPVNFLSRRMKRGLAIAIVYIGLILVPFGLLALLVPPIVTQVNHLVDNAPQYARDVTDFVNNNDQLRKLNQDYDLTGKIEEQASNLTGRVGDVAGVLGNIGLGIVNGVFAGVTILTLAIFMTGGGPRWREWFLRRQPPERAHALRRMFDAIGYSTGNYVRGALLQATIAGFTAFLVLTILGVPSAAALAVVVFVLDLIPLVGATLGAIIVGIVTLVAGDFPIDLIVWVIYSIVYQQVENNVIQPRIQARAVKLEPFLVVISVLFGASLFGVVGALLAVPFAAAIQIIVIEYWRFRGGGFNDPADEGPPGPPPTGAPAPVAG
jgi:predicted PurR-regulated permease PerM